MALQIALILASILNLSLASTLPPNTTRHVVNVTLLSNTTNVWGSQVASDFLDGLVKYLQWDQIEAETTDEPVYDLPTPEPLILLEANSEAIQSTPQEASEKSVTGKIYGFFQHLGDKIKTAFVHVKDAIAG